MAYKTPKFPRVEISPELHKRVTAAAKKAGMTNKEFAEKVLGKAAK